MIWREPIKSRGGGVGGGGVGGEGETKRKEAVNIVLNDHEF